MALVLLLLIISISVSAISAIWNAACVIVTMMLTRSIQVAIAAQGRFWHNTILPWTGSKRPGNFYCRECRCCSDRLCRTSWVSSLCCCTRGSIWNVYTTGPSLWCWSTLIQDDCRAGWNRSISLQALASQIWEITPYICRMCHRICGTNMLCYIGKCLNGYALLR